MNENKADNTFNTNNVCRVCLNSTKHLFPMSNEHIKLYRSLVEEIVYDEYMKNCVICQWMLQRFTKFKEQCWTANHLLSKATYADSKLLVSQHENLKISHNISQTSLDIHNYNPALDNTFRPTHNYSVQTHNTHNNTSCNNTLQYTIFTQTYIKDAFEHGSNDHDSVETFDNHDYTTENKYTNDDEKYINDTDKYTNDHDKYINGKDKYTNDHDKYTNDNDKYTNDHDKYINDHDKYINENDIINDDRLYNSMDEDELPLVLIRSKRTKKKKRKKKDIKETLNTKDSPPIIMKESSIKQEDELVEKKVELVKPKRSKKVLKEGFSSRMVQETSEYVVIKLTREQVLQEMSDRGKTDAYVSSPFKCDKCVKGFNFQDVLDAHMEKHYMKNGTLACDMCEQYCPSAVSLRGHVKSHTTRYKCKVCGAVRVSRQHLLEHHAQHSGSAPAYSCLHCAFTTNKRTVMQRHARGHAPREPHACHKCGKLFKSIDYLRLHTQRHDKSSRFQCSLCPDTFVYHSLLRRHVRCVHERREFYCVECDLHFKCAESLRVHFKRAKRHRDPTALKHACGACPGRFPSAGSLATHLSSAHDAAKQHACLHCHRAYSTRDAVRAHTWRVHSRGDARAACPHCHASFARKSVLRAHLRALGGACGARRARAPLDKLEKEELPQYGNKTEV